MTELISEITEIVRDVFGDDEIVLTETTTAADVDGWDSLMHLNLVIAFEGEFGVKFTTSEISTMKEEGQNIGTLAALIASKKG